MRPQRTSVPGRDVPKADTLHGKVWTWAKLRRIKWKYVYDDLKSTLINKLNNKSQPNTRYESRSNNRLKYTRRQCQDIDKWTSIFSYDTTCNKLYIRTRILPPDVAMIGSRDDIPAYNYIVIHPAHDKIEIIRKSYFDPAIGGFRGTFTIWKKLATCILNISRKEVKTVLDSIELRQMNAPQRQTIPSPIESTDRKRLQIDLVDMMHFASSNHSINFLMVCIDHWSKYVWVFPLKHKHAVPISNIILNKILLVVGKFDIAHVDNGTEFNRLEVLQRNGWFKKITHGLPYKSTSQGAVERVNRTIRSACLKWMTENNKRSSLSKKLKYAYIETLPYLVSSYNSSTSKSTLTTPHSALFNCNHQLPLHRIIGTANIPSETIDFRPRSIVEICLVDNIIFAYDCYSKFILISRIRPFADPNPIRDNKRYKVFIERERTECYNDLVSTSQKIRVGSFFNSKQKALDAWNEARHESLVDEVRLGICLPMGSIGKLIGGSYFGEGLRNLIANPHGTVRTTKLMTNKWIPGGGWVSSVALQPISNSFERAISDIKQLKKKSLVVFKHQSRTKYIKETEKDREEINYVKINKPSRSWERAVYDYNIKSMQDESSPMDIFLNVHTKERLEHHVDGNIKKTGLRMIQQYHAHRRRQEQTCSVRNTICEVGPSDHDKQMKLKQMVCSNPSYMSCSTNSNINQYLDVGTAVRISMMQYKGIRKIKHSVAATSLRKAGELSKWTRMLYTIDEVRIPCHVEAFQARIDKNYKDITHFINENVSVYPVLRNLDVNEVTSNLRVTGMFKTDDLIVLRNRNPTMYVVSRISTHIPRDLNQIEMDGPPRGPIVLTSSDMQVVKYPRSRSIHKIGDRIRISQSPKMFEIGNIQSINTVDGTLRAKLLNGTIVVANTSDVYSALVNIGDNKFDAEDSKYYKGKKVSSSKPKMTIKQRVLRPRKRKTSNESRKQARIRSAEKRRKNEKRRRKKMLK